MRRALLALTVTLVLNSGLAPTLASAAGLMEAWYLSRGQANMSIGNYKAAIEAYEKVVAMSPHHREALRTLGLAYERQGLTDKAIQTFDVYLEKYEDDPEIAFKQAQALEWSRYRYREKDLLRYYRLGLKHKDDPQMRLRYAQHLAKKKETSAEAVQQYEQVLARQPRNPAAHRGLAKAYAWLGDNDRALYHTNLALAASGPRAEGDMTALRQDMMRGREPTLQGKSAVLIQPQRPFELYGLRLGSAGKVDLTPFTTTILETGLEHFRDASQNASGLYVSLANEVRINPTNRLTALLEYHDVVRADGLAYRFEYAHDGESLSLRPGVRRQYRYDSFTSFAGSRIAGRLVGAARVTEFYTDVLFDLGDVHVLVTPFVGWVSAESLSRNPLVGFDGRLSRSLWRGEGWEVAGEYLLGVSHYGEDQSGFTPSMTEPLAGGYFSPRVFVNQIPRLALTYLLPNKDELYLAVGPALQYIDEAQRAGVLRIGGDGHAAYTTHLSTRFLLKGMADFTQIATVYTRVQLQGLLVYQF